MPPSSAFCQLRKPASWRQRESAQHNRQADMAMRSGGSALHDMHRAVADLDGWLGRNGWAGYDPYDIRGHPLMLKLLKHDDVWPLRSVVATGLGQLVDRFPRASRSLLRIRKKPNAKAMGLFASAYLRLHQRLGTASYLEKATECLDWLRDNRIQGYSGYCWGHPFDWRSRVMLPEGTPLSTVAAVCGDAFWDFYGAAKDRRYLDVCEGVCEFFINDLNIDEVGKEQACFSYSPIDRFHVHNANLMVADLLTKVGVSTQRNEFLEYGMRAFTYTLSAQNEDGSFYYWSLSDRDVYRIPDAILRYIDHYHTGFVLRSLHSIYRNSGDGRAFDALEKGYRFYVDNLFGDGMIPKFTPDLLYPITDVWTSSVRAADN